MDKKVKIEKKAQEYQRKQKESNLKMNMEFENIKEEKVQTLEQIMEEVHDNDDSTADFVANELIKQSSELQRRLAERRRKARDIQSCKNAGAKSFFRFDTSIVSDRIEKLGGNAGLSNLSMIKQDSTFGENLGDESFSYDMFNKLPDTDTSTQNMPSKIMTQSQKPHLRIETSLSEEDEEEEEESEDEKLEQNLLEIWKECEKVFETLQTEKEEATNKFLEEFASNKFEKIAELKHEMKQQLAECDESEKPKIESEYKVRITKLEKSLQEKKDEGLSEIKKRFYKRKQSIVSKLDMESAKNKLKASLCYGKDLSFLSTPSSQSFYLSPYDMDGRKAQPVSGQLLPRDHSGQPMEKLVSPSAHILRMPKTPNRMTKIEFNLNTSQSANK